MQLDAFISKWSASQASERANKDSFLNELCDVLQVPRPDPTTGHREQDKYVFEKDVAIVHEGGRHSVGRIDLYKDDSFILEAKQGSTQGSRRLGTAKRDTPGWSVAMRDAFGQALGYARMLEAPPPFIITCDIGYCFELYACFDGSRDYRPFPDAQHSRVFLKDLATHQQRLRTIFTDAMSLDPSRYAARVTREVATHLAELAKALEAAGNAPETVATFLMRCIFTMFAEDVGLLQGPLFTRALQERWIPKPSTFKSEIENLWRAMNEGTDFGFERLLQFNGGLFANPSGLALSRPHLELLLEASNCNWAEVEPAIFGTLVERALNPRERHALGAHYTPRAYVERLIRPTLEEPLRQDWAVVQMMVRQLVADDKVSEAQNAVRDFHQRLRSIRVLDPACGSGNFLYVTLDLFKRLEVEVLKLLFDLGDRGLKLGTAADSVTPDQFLGIEVNPRAKAIAELVLWIGFLQWHFRTMGSVLPAEPVLRNYGKNIECRDAVLAYDGREVVRDGSGLPVTRWDGVSFKRHAVTGEEVPDETQRIPVYRYLNPRKAEWPAADFIVGNPPFIGNWRMRSALGDGYTEILRKTWPEVPDSCDFVMYWWEKAASLVQSGKARRFGLITTNSLTQSFGRKVTQPHLEARDPLSLVFAIPDHPWADTEDGADVRIAMTVAEAGQKEGRLFTVTEEREGQEGVVEVSLSERTGLINTDLKIGANIPGAKALRAMSSICSPGVKLHGAGFIVTPDEAAKLGLGRIEGLEKYILKYRNGRDLAATSRNVLVIDLDGLRIEEVRSLYPEVYQWILHRVKPERDLNNEAYRRENWWLFGRRNTDLRSALVGLNRYISTPETAKHRFFVFLESDIRPDNKLVNIADADAFVLGVLSSRIHVTWALAAGGRLEDRPVYVKTTCFDNFPFPAPSEALKARVRAAGESLDAHRKRQQSLHPDVTMTGMYNVLEKLKSGEALDGKEKVIHENGLVSLLKQLHEELDAAVFEAYGWPPDLSDEQILEKLVALNAERVEEERQGHVRWLRPEFQNPGGQREATQAALPGIEDAAPDAPEATVELAPWPKQQPERLSAVRDLLRKQPRAWELEQVASTFKGARRKDVETALSSLVSLGLAVQYKIDDSPRWQAAR